MIRQAPPTSTGIPVKSTNIPIQNALYAATLSLVVLGLWMVFDTSYAKALDSSKIGNDAFFFVKKQAQGVVVGMLAMFLAMRLGYWRLKQHAGGLMVVSLVLLIAVWLPHVGVVENNAHRWVNLIHFKFQPSELAKLALILYLSAMLSRNHVKVHSLAGGLGPPLTVAALTLVLIEREPDLGTAVVLFMVVLTILFLAGARVSHLLLIIGGAVLAVAVLGFGFKHRGDRIDAFLHPDKYKRSIGYQSFHSRVAVGSGEIMGVGLGQGREKYYLPQADTDFVFATMAEELGFARTAPILGVLCLVGGLGFRIAWQTKERFGALLAGGIAALISWQALVNIAVATVSIPATGVPLPFISYGSTSLVLLLAGIGILMSVAQHPNIPVQSGTKRE